MGRKKEAPHRKKMVPTKAYYVKNFKYHSLGSLKSRALDLLPNHNAGHKSKTIKLKRLKPPWKDEHKIEFTATSSSTTEWNQTEVTAHGINRSKNMCTIY